jgi:hypothetical protein
LELFFARFARRPYDPDEVLSGIDRYRFAQTRIAKFDSIELDGHRSATLIDDQSEPR